MSIILFTFGAIFGSFLNVLIYRLPEGIGVVRKKSHCPKCGRTLKWHELVPVLSFFLLRGKCQKCLASPDPAKRDKAKISWQYPAVEIISGFIWVLVFYKNFPGLEFGTWDLRFVSDFGFRILDFVYQIFILSAMVVISFIDAQ